MLLAFIVMRFACYHFHILVFVLVFLPGLALDLVIALVLVTIL